MFTGLVEQVGKVLSREERSGGARLRIGGSWPGASVARGDLALGESVSVNGVCLTVISSTASSFDADASTETLRLTTLGKLAPGSKVNLERATQAHGRLGGHVVLGHVDGVATLTSRTPSGEAIDLAFELPRDLAPFVATKGSIAIDGVSLTLNAVEDRASGSLVHVMIIPHTAGATTLQSLAQGDHVNVEVDVLARYVFRQLSLARMGVESTGGRAYVASHVDADGDAHAAGDERILSALKRGGYA